MTHPAPRAEGASPREGVNWQEMFDLADSERLRSGIAADGLFARANASDQQSAAQRDTARNAARSQRRRETVFRALALIVARVAADPMILERLREIAQQEAMAAAEREAAAAGEDDGVMA